MDAVVDAMSGLPAWGVAVAALLGLVGAVGLVLGVMVASAKATKKTRMPKGFVRPAGYPFPEPKRTVKGDPTRDAFRAKKVPEDTEYIVIGSGIGGLYCAGLLAKAGHKCVVLEQHYVAGGCTHEFDDKGYSFDTGVHYVGRMEKYKQLLDMVSDPKAKVEWNKMGSEADGWCYDEISVGPSGKEITVRLPAGEKQFVAAITKLFPEERAGVLEYVRLCKLVNKKADLHMFGKLFPVWLERLLGKILNKEFETYAAMTLQQVLDSLFTDHRIKAVLSGQFGDYGLPPDKASFFIHAGVVSHYLGGAWYPVGGTKRIASAIIPTIEAAGGRVLVKAKVAGIIVRPGTNEAVGVRMESGQEVLSSKGVISSAGGVNTYHRLLPDAVRARVLPQLPSMVRDPAVGDSGISHVYCFVGLNGTAEELKLPSANLWRLPTGADYDVNKMCEHHYQNPFTEDGELLLFVGFPSSKDPEYSAKHPGKSTAIIITEAKAEWFSPDKYGASASGKRGPEYEALLEGFKKRLLKGLQAHYPQVEGKIEYCKMASPLTNQFYLERYASYGLPHTPDRYTGAGAGGLRPQSPVDKLWLTGQDVCVNGYVAALMGGVLTAHTVLGYGALDLMILGRNLIEDTMNVRD